MSGANEKVPSFEEFVAPWEVDSDGNEIPEDEQEVDRTVLKKLLWNLRRDKAKAVNKRAEVESERDELKEKVTEKESKARDGESEVDRLKREVAELKQAKPAEDPKAKLENVRLRAALKAGLAEEHIKRLDPDLTDFDDLVEDAEKLKGSFGGNGSTDNDDDDDTTDTPRGRPTRQRTNGDPKGGRRSNEVSIDDLLEKVPSSQSFRT